jgi:hypothetical protein
MADSMDFSWLIPVVLWGFIFFVGISLFAKVANAIGLSNMLGFWQRRQKPVQQKRDNYDDLLLHDLKKSARRNRVPCKELYFQDKDDWEHPIVYWGKIRGITAETDVAEVLVRRKWSIFSEILFVPTDRMSDLHSKELHISGVGARVIARYFWQPVWGAAVPKEARMRLDRITLKHIDARYHELQNAVGREESTAQMVASMEPRLESGRAAAVFKQPQAIPAEPETGEENLEGSA